MKINKEYKILITILTIVILIISTWLFNKYYIWENDIINNTDKYLNSLSSKLEKQWVKIDNSKLKDYLTFIDQLYTDWQLQVNKKYYYYPENWQNLSYREQYLFYFLNY